MTFPVQTRGGYGVTKVQLRGHSTAIGTGAETIWGPAASTYAQLTTATALEVISSSASDAAAGTGARTVRVDYLDGDYSQASQTVTLNGTNAVAMTDTTIIAVNRVVVLTAGSGGVNAGTISVRTVVGSTVKAQINSDAKLPGQSADFVFTIPLGMKGVLMPVRFSGSTITGDLSVYVLSFSSAGLQIGLGSGNASLDNTGFNNGQGIVDFGEGLILPEKTLIEGRAIASAGVGDLVAMADLYLFNSGINAWPFNAY